MRDFFFQPHLIALVVLAMFYLLFSALSGRKWSPVDLFVGADKRPSTSKFQLFIWLLIGLYSYLVIYAARAWHHFYDAVDFIPPNLLTAMGFSVFTAAAAKGITAGYVETGRSARADAPETRPDPANAALNVKGSPLQAHTGLASLFTDDNGHPDLSKIQIICWTFIAVGIYLFGLFTVVNKMPDVLTETLHQQTGGRFTPTFVKANPEVIERISIPDISAALMVLMGLGHGAYIGKKLVTFDTARLTLLNPPAGKPGTEVTITGVSLSTAPDGNQVTLNRKPIDGALEAKNSQVKFALPTQQPDGSAWQPGEVIQIGVITNGQDSANTLSFTVTVPELKQLQPDTGPVGTGVTLMGNSFGAAQGGSQVLINDVPVAATNWSDTAVKFAIPAWHARGACQIVVDVAGQPRTKARTFTVT